MHSISKLVAGFHQFISVLSVVNFMIGGKIPGAWPGDKTLVKAMNDCLSRGNPGEFTVNSSRNAREVYEHLGFVAQSEMIMKNGVTFTPMKIDVRAADKA